MKRFSLRHKKKSDEQTDGKDDPASPINQRHSSVRSYRNSANASSNAGVSENGDSEGTPWKRYKLLDSPFPRYRHSALQILSEKGEVFLIGGLKDGSVYSDTWKLKLVRDFKGAVTGYEAQCIEIANNNMPSARVGHSTVLCGNAYVIFGGDTVDTDFQGRPDNNLYLFNINNNKYTIPTHIQDKPSGRYGQSIGVVSVEDSESVSRLYVFGGQLEEESYDDLYFFELNSFKNPKAKWHLVEPANNFKPPPVSNHSMNVRRNKLYIFGGIYNNEKVSNDLWCFDISLNKWSQIPTSGELPPPMNEHASCIVGENLYVYGGNDFSGIIYDSLYVLNMSTWVWSALSPSGYKNGPGSRCGHSMTYMPSLNRLLIIGGDKNDYASVHDDDFEAYDQYTGREKGTIIYELDLNKVSNFLVGEKEIKQDSQQPKKLAASANNKRALNDTSSVGSHHGRSASADDYRTPNHSPMGRKPPMEEPTSKQDPFIEVGDSVMSANNTISEASFTGDPLVESIAPNGKSPHADILDESRPAAKGATAGPSTTTPAKADKVFLRANEEELKNELSLAKASSRAQAEKASHEIDELVLELENVKEENYKNITELKDKIRERDFLVADLKKQLDPSALEPIEVSELEARGAPHEVGLSEFSKYKIQILELGNKVTHLELINSSLNKSMQHFEPFMDNQMEDVGKLQRIMKVQEEKIEKLSETLKEQEPVLKENSKWKNEYENLKLEFDNFKILHMDDYVPEEKTIEKGEPGEEGDENYSTTVVIRPGQESKKQMSSYLEDLVSTWSTRKTDKDTQNQKDKDSRTGLVEKLQGQLDQLLGISKEQESTSAKEVASLRKALKEREETISMLEGNYQDAVQSVNNTSKALNFTQEQLGSQRSQIEKLITENNELKMFKKASEAAGKSPSKQAREATPDKRSPEGMPEEDVDTISNAHYNMKVKDLQADMYIIRQERDQLRDTVLALQKELYLSQSN